MQRLTSVAHTAEGPLRWPARARPRRAARRPSDQVIDGFGQIDVVYRDAAGVASAKAQRDLVVADVDVGMVLPLLSHLGEVLDEADSVDEIGEAEGPCESSVP